MLGALSTLPFLGRLAEFALRRRATGTDELRPVLAAFDTRFGDVIAFGGQTADTFSSEDRARETALRHLCPRLQDKKLREACEGVLASWVAVFASAPPLIGPHVVSLVDYEHSNPEYFAEVDAHRKQMTRQVDAARDGQAAVTAAHDRATTLDRAIAGMT
jgi:hypothetical protein